MTTPPLMCPGPGPAADWREQGWCCRECTALSHLAWCPLHGTPNETFAGTNDRPAPFTLTFQAPTAPGDGQPPVPGPDVTIWRHVATLVAWLDDAHPRTGHEIACRVMKLAEETGEAVAAYIGMTGQNPRKGRCATRDDLASELCDVIVTAMVALATIAGDGDPETIMQAHLSARFARLLTRIGQPPDTAPEASQ